MQIMFRSVCFQLKKSLVQWHHQFNNVKRLLETDMQDEDAMDDVKPTYIHFIAIGVNYTYKICIKNACHFCYLFQQMRNQTLKS